MNISHPFEGHLMEGAFLGFVEYAGKNLLNDYISDSGKINLGTSPLDQMIDKATGKDIDELQRFVDWCVIQFGHPEDI